MEIRKHEVEVNNIKKTDFVFDIETTGFSPDYCTISSISYLFYEENRFIIKQIFSENGDDKKILETFLKDLNSNYRLISFNGDRFDLPFISKRLILNNINKDITNESLDLYAYLKNNKQFSIYPAIGQKKLEVLYGIERQSDLDGKKAVQLYKEYLKTKNTSIKNDLLYYNYLDVYYLSKLFSIYYDVEEKKKILVYDKEFFIENINLKKDILSLNMKTELIVPYPIEIVNKNSRFIWNEKAKIDLDLIHGLISPNLMGSVFQCPSHIQLKDMSDYPLSENLILVKDDSYNTENIKNIAKAILEDSLKKYKEDIC